MDICLVHPEIPHNTGCAARLSAALGLPLHLVRPLGFSLEDRYLKRAGLDYWPQVELVVHEDLDACLTHFERSGGRELAQRLRPFTARGGTSLFEVGFRDDDVLVFGSESSGLAEAALGGVRRASRLRPDPSGRAEPEPGQRRVPRDLHCPAPRRRPAAR